MRHLITGQKLALMVTVLFGFIAILNVITVYCKVIFYNEVENDKLRIDKSIHSLYVQNAATMYFFHSLHSKSYEFKKMLHLIFSSGKLKASLVIYSLNLFCRLPSPFNKGSKCPTITNPSCKDSGSHSNSNLNNSRSSRSTPTSSDRNKAQLNQQNNNVTSGKFKSRSSGIQGTL